MAPRSIDRTIVICSCRKPVTMQVIPGETVRVRCGCGNIMVETFPSRKIADRKEEIRMLIEREPANRWEAIANEFLFDELKELEKNS